MVQVGKPLSGLTGAASGGSSALSAAGSILGVAPFTLGTTLVGIRVAAWLEDHPVATWPWDQIWPVVIAATAAIVAIGILALRKWRKTAVE